MPATPAPAAGASEYDRLLRQHLTRVFGERDPGRRLRAVEELYAPDATLFDSDIHAVGHAAIAEAVGTLLAAIPGDVSFGATGPAVGHHGAARLQWRGGPPGGPAVVSGTDVALIEDGRITALYVFLDPEVRA